MKYAFLILLFIYGCNGNDGGSKNKAKISSGDIAASEGAKAFVQSSISELQLSHQMTESELEQWVKEGLISQDEANEIKEHTTPPTQNEEL